MRRCTSFSAGCSPRASAAAAWAMVNPVPVSREPTTGGTSAPQTPETQPGSVDRLSIGGERHGDVAPRRVGVGADLVGGLDELDGLLALDRGQRHIELDRQVEAAAVVGVQGDLGVD